MQKDAWSLSQRCGYSGSLVSLSGGCSSELFEADTGLARPNSFLSWAVALLCIAAAAVLLFR